MKVCVNAAQLAQVLNAACKDKLRQECELEALQDRIFLKVTDGAAYAEIAIPAVVQQPGTVFIYVPPLLKLLKAVGSEEVTLFPHPELSRLVVQLPNEAQYLLPLGYNLNRTDNDNAFQSKVRELMNQASPFISFANGSVWSASKAVKPYRGDWDFSYIWVLPVQQKPEWAQMSVVAAIAATDQLIFAASLLTDQQAEVLTSENSVLLVPPDLTDFAVNSFAYAAESEDKQYVYAILDDGYVCAPTIHAPERYYRIAHQLLFEPASIRLQISRSAWQQFRKAVQVYSERRSRSSKSADTRWDICPDGTHRIWSSVERNVLFTSEKIAIEGTLPRTVTFWLSLLEQALKFIPTPAVIELLPQQSSCMMRLHDPFNYRICVIMSMVAESDFDSFTGSKGGSGQTIVDNAESEEVSSYAEV